MPRITEPLTERFNVWFTADEMEMITLEAISEGRSLGNMVRQLAREALIARKADRAMQEARDRVADLLLAEDGPLNEERRSIKPDDPTMITQSWDVPNLPGKEDDHGEL